MIVQVLVLGLVCGHGHVHVRQPAGVDSVAADDTIHRGPLRPRQWARFSPDDAVMTVSALRDPDDWFGEDKIKHFAFSFAITAGMAGAARLITDSDNSVWAGAAFGLAAGVGKELYDQKSRNAASLRDLIWDLAGVGAGVLLMQQVR